MNLTDFLSGKGKAPKKGDTTDWLRFGTIEVPSGVLWAGDPYVLGDGCAVKVQPGKYVLQALATASHRQRIVARLIVCHATAKFWSLGKKAGDTGTDSAMIGVCDARIYRAALKRAGVEKATAVISANSKRGFGIVQLEPTPGATMSFIPTGSDGVGPVYRLVAAGKCVGISLDFTGEDEDDAPATEPSLLGKDEPDFRTWPLATGGEASCWVGGTLKAGKPVHIWCDAPKGPVSIRIRQGKAPLDDWTPLKKKRANDPFGLVKKLPAGKYEIDFQVGGETFSAVRFQVKP